MKIPLANDNNHLFPESIGDSGIFADLDMASISVFLD
jgi:hypothetical protein